MRKIAIAAALLLGSSCSTNFLFRVNTSKPVEIQSRSFVPGHNETRRHCEWGFKLGFDGKMHSDPCGNETFPVVWVEDAWFLGFFQCRGWTHTPMTDECEASDTVMLEVGRIEYQYSEGMMNKRVRSIRDLRPVEIG